MKFFAKLLVVALAAEGAIAGTWFSKAVYNKWHETELERWLSDNNVPYPTPADRKDLENLVKNNWESKIASPYKEWDTAKLATFLKSRGGMTKDAAVDNKDSLVAEVKNYWYETEDKAEDAWNSVKDWIFDSWSDSSLKAFADYHHIPVPQPHKRDTLLQKLRSSYDTIAKKADATIHYPGDWLYETWSESDLKEWLDEHGIPAPQPTTRDKLIASVRRNSRLASLKMADYQASASASSQEAADALTDKLVGAWTDSQLKDFMDKNGIKVPQGSKRNELMALFRKHRAQLTGDTLSYSASSAFGAATSKAGNQYAKATDDAQLKAQSTFDAAVSTWSESRLKGFLDERGIPVLQGSKKDELIALARLHKHKAATGYSAWTFDTWTVKNLRNYLVSSGNVAAQKVADDTSATRDELLKAAQDTYASASSSGGAAYASATSYLAKATDTVKDSAFDTWSDSELKAFLDTYGVPVPQGSKTNELRAWARNQANYFRYGTTTPQGTLYAKLAGAGQWFLDQIYIGAASGKKQIAYQGEKATDGVKEAGTYATNRAEEAAQKAGHYIKEEL